MKRIMAKSGNRTLLIMLSILLGSCSPATPPPPLNVITDMEFTLAPGQSAAVIDAVFTIRLLGVSSDERCPLEIECAASGPVTLTITLQKAPGPPTEYTLQTFTDNDGRAPQGPFEGIQDRIEFEGYLIQVKGVSPFPARTSNEIKDSDYRVSFLVAEK